MKLNLTTVEAGEIAIDQFYTGNASDLLTQIDDNSIDMVLTSPPYDNLRNYKNGHQFDFYTIAQHLNRVLVDGGVICWNVSDATNNGGESLTSFRQALYFQELGLSVETMIINTGAGGAKGSRYLYTQAHEYLFVCFRGTRPLFGELIRDHANKYAGTKNTSTRRRPDGTRRKLRFETPALSKRTNVWRVATGGGISGDWLCHNHPAPMAESLARDLIVSFSNPGQIILDPFCGSGTTAKMALENNRHYIGFDISADYIALARQRVAQAQRPLRLFTEHAQVTA